MLRIFLFILFTLLSQNLLYSQTEDKADFLLIENPVNLTIYNRYQQTLTEKEKLEFEHFTPFLVVESYGSFGDGLRNYIKAEYKGIDYFILAEKEFEPVNSKSAGKIVLLKNKSVIRDTVIIISNNKMTQRLPNSREVANLQSGERLYRVFKDVSEYYVYNLNDGKYGWVKFASFPEKKFWSKEGEVYTAQGMGYLETLSKIDTRVEEYNKVILALYQHFNEKKQTNLATPYWAVNEQKNYTDILFLDQNENFERAYDKMLDEIKKVLALSSLDYEEVKNGLRIKLN